MNIYATHFILHSLPDFLKYKTLYNWKGGKIGRQSVTSIGSKVYYLSE